MCFAVVLFCLTPVAFSQDFNVQQISRDNIHNSDPVISETGLAAWMYYDTNTGATAHSHIILYQNGKIIELTAESTTILSGATKPLVQSNKVVFVANYKQFVSASQNWVLRDVVTRDEGEIKEVDANYGATEEAGEQRIFPLNPPVTNEQGEVSYPVGTDTNAPRRQPSGVAEIWAWEVGDQAITRITHDVRNDFAPAVWGDHVVWQKAKGWPFGWEIMALIGDQQMQLTTNYYYDMAPKVHGSKVVWYGWDGFDYEIYLVDTEKGELTQITSNRYDDVAPQVWNNTIVWEGYPAVEADIYMWKDGTTTKLSSNVDDDLYPRIWGDKIVWQGFDGDDFEIYLYDTTRGELFQLTGNRHDDTNPEISGNLVVWMGYEGNWDAEIFHLDVSNLTVGNIKPLQLTDNDEDDRDAKTGGGNIIWVAEDEGETKVMLAEPR